MPQIRTKKFFFVKNIDNSGFLLTLYVMLYFVFMPFRSFTVGKLYIPEFSSKHLCIKRSKIFKQLRILFIITRLVKLSSFCLVRSGCVAFNHYSIHFLSIDQLYISLVNFILNFLSIDQLYIFLVNYTLYFLSIDQLYISLVNYTLYFLLIDQLYILCSILYQQMNYTYTLSIIF